METTESGSVIAEIAGNSRSAWATGQRYYAIDITHFMNKSAEKSVLTEPTLGWYAGRQVGWEAALDAIPDIGWERHTWTPSNEVSGNYNITRQRGRALFVRPSDAA